MRIDVRRDVVQSVGKPYPLARRRALGERQPRPPFRRRPNGPLHEAAAAVRADIVQVVVDAVGTEGALVGADARHRPRPAAGRDRTIRSWVGVVEPFSQDAVSDGRGEPNRLGLGGNDKQPSNPAKAADRRDRCVPRRPAPRCRRPAAGLRLRQRCAAPGPRRGAVRDAGDRPRRSGDVVGRAGVAGESPDARGNRSIRSSLPGVAAFTPRRRTGISSHGWRSGRVTPGAWPRSAPARSCSVRPASSTVAAPSPTGWTAPSWRGVFRGRASRAIRSSFATAASATSAGVTAGIDLALALVEEDLGRGIAMAVARDLVVFLKRPGGQAQFSGDLALQDGDARFRAAARLDGEPAGATSRSPRWPTAGMSERSFARRYRAATGATPARAVEQVRVEAARHLLEGGRSR